jgi:hypothetical protein
MRSKPNYIVTALVILLTLFLLDNALLHKQVIRLEKRVLILEEERSGGL